MVHEQAHLGEVFEHHQHLLLKPLGNRALHATISTDFQHLVKLHATL